MTGKMKYGWSRAATVALAAALVALASCGPGKNGKSGAVPGEGGATTAVHLVKIAYKGQEIMLKGFFEGTAQAFAVKAQSGLGMGLFTATWDGEKLECVPASDEVAGMVPFDLRGIAVDIWQMVSLGAAEDIARYNEHNSPPLKVDSVETVEVSTGVKEKRIGRGGKVAVLVTYHEARAAGQNPFFNADRIVLTNNDLGYEITVVQKFTGE